MEKDGEMEYIKMNTKKKSSNLEMLSDGIY
jgi:hypothetical protein